MSSHFSLLVCCMPASALSEAQSGRVIATELYLSRLKPHNPKNRVCSDGTSVPMSVTSCCRSWLHTLFMSLQRMHGLNMCEMNAQRVWQKILHLLPRPWFCSSGNTITWSTVPTNTLSDDACAKPSSTLCLFAALLSCHNLDSLKSPPASICKRPGKSNMSASGSASARQKAAMMEELLRSASLIADDDEYGPVTCVLHDLCL